jgi:predicted dehydrogenase
MDRRHLLKSAAALAAMASTATAQKKPRSERNAAKKPRPAPATGPAPSNRLSIGVIGLGGLGYGHHLLNKLLPEPRFFVTAVCDVDLNNAEKAGRAVMEATGRRPGVYQDFRRLLDRADVQAVLIATPDHWHALIAIAAMEAGKDVYCEKPLSLTVAEGKAMVAAARRYGTVFQTGSQQRSEDTFRRACELVRNGALGRLTRVDTVLHPVEPGTWQVPETPPPGLDWDFWLGQAPRVEYRPNLVHNKFRWRYDYSGGVMTDWGAHHNDIAQWAMGTDHTGPVRVDGTDSEFDANGPYDVPLHFNVRYEYANGVELVCHTDGRNGVTFTGERGTLFVCRGKILQASDPAILQLEPAPGGTRLPDLGGHHQNWLDCIASRSRPICDVEIGHRSVTICHIGNISMRLRRPLRWDPVREAFEDDAEANRMLSRPMRAPWHL